MTTLLGARRAATAWERFRAETLADDAFVSIPSRPDPGVADERAALPGVIDATSLVYVSVTLRHTDLPVSPPVPTSAARLPPAEVLRTE